MRLKITLLCLAVLLNVITEVARANEVGICSSEQDCKPREVASLETDTLSAVSPQQQQPDSGDPAETGTEHVAGPLATAASDPGSSETSETSEIKLMIQQQIELKELLAQAKLSLNTLEQVVIKQDARLRQLLAHRPLSTPPGLSASLGDHPDPIASHPQQGQQLQQPVPITKTAQASTLRKGWGHYLEFMGAVQVEGNVNVIHTMAQRSPHPKDMPVAGIPPRHIAIGTDSSAVEGNVNVIHTMAQRSPQPKDMPVFGIPPRHIAIGTDSGAVYVFNSLGDLSRDHDTGTTSPVIAMTSMYVKKNETLLVTAHEDGEKGGNSLNIMMWFSNGLVKVQKAEDGRELYNAPSTHAPLAMLSSGTLVVTLSERHVTMTRSSLAMAPWSLTLRWSRGYGQLCPAADAQHLCKDVDVDPSLCRQVPHKPVCMTYAAWAALVYCARQMPKHMPKHVVNGNADVDPSCPVRCPSTCARNADVDPSCPVIPKHVIRVQPSGVPTGVPVSMASLRGGYLVVGHPTGVLLLNVSNVVKGSMQIITTESVSTLASSIGHSHSEVATPLLRTHGDKMGGFLAVSLGQGSVAFFDGGIPLTLPPSMVPVKHSSYWLQPIMIGLIIVVAYFQFNRAQRRSTSERGAGGRGRGTSIADMLMGGLESTQGNNRPVNYGGPMNQHSANLRGVGIPARTARRLARQGDRNTIRKIQAQHIQQQQRPPTVMEEDEGEIDEGSD
eukprot:gene7036-129_t